MLAVPVLFASLAVESPTPAPQASATPAPTQAQTRSVRRRAGAAQEISRRLAVRVRRRASEPADNLRDESIPADVILDLGGSTADATASRSAFGYPGAIVNVGITHNAQITILPPSFSQLRVLARNAGSRRDRYGVLVQAARSTSTAASGILGGLLLTYEAPTGTPGLAAPGPAYTINPLLNIATNRARTMGVSLAFPVSNFATASSSGITRGWSFAPQAVPFWRSPGGTLLALVVSHDFTTNATPLLLNTAQLVTRQFQFQATYGGVNSAVDLANPLAGVTRAQGTSYSRTLTIGGSYMFGTSDL